METELRRSTKTAAPAVGLLALLALSLAMLAGMADDSALFDRYRLWLLGFNLLVLALFAGLILARLLTLGRRLRRTRPGARLTLRLVLLFLPMALIPAAALYFFAMWSLDRGIASWFDVNIENALDDALTLGRQSLALQLSQHRERAASILPELEALPDEVTAYDLNALLEESGASEIALIGGNLQIISSASAEVGDPLPDLPPEEALRAVARGEEYANIAPLQGGGLYTRLVFPLARVGAFGDARLAQLLFPVSERINRQAAGIEDAYSHYQRLSYLRDALSQNLIIVLTLVLLSGVLYAVWLSFYSSQQLMSPITRLSDAIREIASGRLDVRVGGATRDELGFLVSSFNDMARNLAEARDAGACGRAEIENKNAYLRTVLRHVSSGVLTFDADFCLTGSNRAAQDILEAPALEGAVGRPMRPADDGCAPALRALCARILPAFDREHDSWEQELTLQVGGAGKTLICHGARMPGSGYVAVFNDITQLVREQRNTAWKEVAQRLAHETKNPLTPIQLAAERLPRKLSAKLGTDDRGFLERSVHTIVQQVKAMKNMVDEFGDYARDAPRDTPELRLNHVVAEVAELYLALRAPEISVALSPDDPVVRGNEAGLRQLLHNLLKNAREALEDRPQGRVVIATRVAGDKVELEVRDNGPGFAPQVLEQAFEPYVTVKRRGTGLGLPIVRKIAEEHGGVARIDNPPDGGARVLVELPRAGGGA